MEIGHFRGDLQPLVVYASHRVSARLSLDLRIDISPRHSTSFAF